MQYTTTTIDTSEKTTAILGDRWSQKAERGGIRYRKHSFMKDTEKTFQVTNAQMLGCPSY